MKIKWEELQQNDVSAMEETIQACQKLVQQRERCFVSKKTALLQYASLELKRIRKVYTLFLASLGIFILFSSQMRLGMVMLYYLLLGSYFLYHIYEFRSDHIAEFMQSLPISEGQHFLLHMCSFLVVHFISFISFSFIGYMQAKIGLLEIVQLALIPLFATHGCMLLFIHRIRHLHTAIVCYIFLFLCFSDLFYPLLQHNSYLQFDWLQTMLLSLTATLLFFAASLRYSMSLRRRRIYGA